MKSFYSSTFLSAILAFLMLLGKTDTPVVVTNSALTPSFQTIIEPVGPAYLPTETKKVKLEVFNRFDCQDCSLFGQGALPQLVEKYTENSQVDLRLYLIPDKEKEGDFYATKGTHCAAKHDRFWDMVYELHKLDILNKREVDLAGQGLNLPVIEFRECLNSEAFGQKIDEDIAYAETKKITQKPTILVNGTMLLGTQPIENVDYLIRKYLNY